MMTHHARPVVRTLSAFALPLLTGVLPAAPERTPREAAAPVSALNREALAGVQYSAGFIDSVQAAVAGNYYSTTQKVNGYTADLAAEAYARGQWLTEEDIDDKDVVPLDEDFLPFRVSLLGGYADNPWLLPNSHAESTFLAGLGLRSFNTLKGEKFQGYLGFNMDNYYFEEAAFSRDGGDNYLQDFTLNTGGLYKFSESVALSSRGQYDYTSFGTFGLGAARPGVLSSDVFRYTSNTQLRYRFDGRALNDPGLGLTTALIMTGYDEAGSSYGDFYRAFLLQELACNQGGPFTYYIQGRIGQSDYRTQDYYNADIYGGMLGVRGACPNCGLTFDLAAGVENYSYDHYGLGDDTVFRAEFSAEGKVTSRIGLRATASYGLQSLLPNAGSSFLDAEGFRGQLRATYAWNEQCTFGLYGEYQELDGFLRSYSYYVIGADANCRVGENIYLTPGILYMAEDGGFQDADNFIGTIRTTFTF